MGRIKFTGMRLTALIVFIALVCGFMFAAREFRLQSAQWHTFTVEGQTILMDTLKIARGTDTARVWVNSSTGDFYLNVQAGDEFRTGATGGGVGAPWNHNGHLFISNNNATSTIIRVTNTASTAGPAYMDMRKLRSTAGASVYPNDFIGVLEYTAENYQDNAVIYGTMSMQCIDSTDGSEDGTWLLRIIKAGSAVPILSADVTGLNVLDTLSIDGGAKINKMWTNSSTGDWYMNVAAGDEFRTGATGGGVGAPWNHNGHVYIANNNATSTILRVTNTASTAAPAYMDMRKLRGTAGASVYPNDFIGVLEYTAENYQDNAVIYGTMSLQAIDSTDGSEDAKWLLQAMVAGTPTSYIIADATGLSILQPLNYSHTIEYVVTASEIDTAFSASAPDDMISGLFPVYSFDAAADEDLLFRLTLPPKFEAAGDITLKIVWAPSTTNANTITWATSYVGISSEAGELTTAGATTTIVTDEALGTANAVQTTGNIVFTTTGWVAGDVVGIKLFRDADASEGGADDDFTGEGLFLEVRITVDVTGI